MSIKEYFAELGRRWDAETPIIYARIVKAGAILGTVGLALEAWPGLTSLPVETQTLVHYATGISIVIAGFAQLQEKK